MKKCSSRRPRRRSRPAREDAGLEPYLNSIGSSRRPRRRSLARIRAEDGVSPSASSAHRAGYDVSGFSGFS